MSLYKTFSRTTEPAKEFKIIWYIFSTLHFAFFNFYFLDAKLSGRSCQSYCLNGGTCSIYNGIGGTRIACTCPQGFSGERCHI